MYVESERPTLPLLCLARTMAYDGRSFAEAALVPPGQSEWHWDQFCVAASKLTRDTNGDGDPDAIAFAGWDEWLEHVILQYASPNYAAGSALVRQGLYSIDEDIYRSVVSVFSPLRDRGCFGIGNVSDSLLRYYQSRREFWEERYPNAPQRWIDQQASSHVATEAGISYAPGSIAMLPLRPVAGGVFGYRFAHAFLGDRGVGVVPFPHNHDAVNVAPVRVLRAFVWTDSDGRRGPSTRRPHTVAQIMAQLVSPAFQSTLQQMIPHSLSAHRRHSIPEVAIFPGYENSGIATALLETVAGTQFADDMFISVPIGIPMSVSTPPPSDLTMTAEEIQKLRAPKPEGTIRILTHLPPGGEKPSYGDPRIEVVQKLPAWADPLTTQEFDILMDNCFTGFTAPIAWADPWLILKRSGSDLREDRFCSFLRPESAPFVANCIPTGVYCVDELTIYRPWRFAENGLQDPKELIDEDHWEWTWERFAAAAGKMTKDLNGDGIPEEWGSFLNGIGVASEIFDQYRCFPVDLVTGQVLIDRPEVRSVLELLRRLSDLYAVWYPGESGAGSLKWSSAYGSAGVVNYFPFDWDLPENQNAQVLPLPRPVEGKYSLSPLQVTGIYVHPESDVHPQRLAEAIEKVFPKIDWTAVPYSNMPSIVEVARGVTHKTLSNGRVLSTECVMRVIENLAWSPSHKAAGYANQGLIEDAILTLYRTVLDRHTDYGEGLSEAYTRLSELLTACIE